MKAKRVESVVVELTQDECDALLEELADVDKDVTRELYDELENV